MSSVARPDVGVLAKRALESAIASLASAALASSNFRKQRVFYV